MLKSELISSYTNQDMQILTNYKKKLLLLRGLQQSQLNQILYLEEIKYIGGQLLKTNCQSFQYHQCHPEQKDDRQSRENDFDLDQISVIQSENICMQHLKNAERNCQTEREFAQSKENGKKIQKIYKQQLINKINNQQTNQKHKLIQTKTQKLTTILNPQISPIRKFRLRNPNLLSSKNSFDDFFQVSDKFDKLLKPVKNFKKKTIIELQQKIKIQAEEYFKMQKERQKNKIKISEFYKNNQNHIPVYKKAKQSQIKKMIKQQQRRIQSQINQLNESTFCPEINTKTKKIVQGTQFYQRLQTQKINKKQKQSKIISEVLEQTPFKPHTNHNTKIKAVSRIKSIWSYHKSMANLNTITDIQEQEDHENFSEFNSDSQKRLQMGRYLSVNIKKSDTSMFLDD